MAFQEFLVPKDPDSVVDYGRKWAEWLSDTDIIIASQWIIATTENPVTLVIESDGINEGGKTTSFWVSGGLAGMTYKLTNRITTNDGRIEDRTGILRVQEK